MSSDGYQAIYDATRSRLSSANSSDAILQAAREAFDISYMKAIAAEQFGVAIEDVANELKRPSVLFRPELSFHASRWYAKWPSRFTVSGATPDEAMRNFDKEWSKP